MKIRVDPSALKHSHWYGHCLRFVLGGAITVVAGLVAKVSGPVIGGFLLAYPAILPAALILLVRSQNEMARPPARGTRGRHAALLAAAGAATGSLGLIAFALVCWRGLGRAPSGAVLAAATIVWAIVAVSAWMARQHAR